MDLIYYLDTFRYDKSIETDKVELINYCISFMKENNIPIPNCSELVFNKTRKQSIFGECTKYKDYYLISLNFNKIKTEMELINTVIHELIHTINFNENHGKTFMHYSKLVGELSNYNIKITKGGPIAVNKDLDNLTYKEKEQYIEKLLFDENPRIIQLLPECFYYFNQKKLHEIIRKIIERFNWEFLFYFQSQHPIKYYISATEKMKYYNDYISGVFDYKVTNLKSAMFLEGFFVLTKYYGDVVSHTKTLIGE